MILSVAFPGRSNRHITIACPPQNANLKCQQRHTNASTNSSVASLRQPWQRRCLSQSVVYRSEDEKKSSSGTQITKIRRPFHVNPPSSTLPPPLQLPSRDASGSTVVHWFKIGRTYSKFYITGFKQVWQNYKLARAAKRDFAALVGPLTSGPSSSPWRPLGAITLGNATLAALENGGGSQRSIMDRATFQLIWRSEKDVKKLPVFALLILITGEWLPLLVPFIPGIFPRPCQIPSQVKASRKQQKERRSNISLLESVAKDGAAIIKANNINSTGHEASDTVLRDQNREQLGNLAIYYNLFSPKWDKLGILPPSLLLRRRIQQHLTYLKIDSALLSVAEDGVGELSDNEVQIACDERGMDVSGVAVDTLRHSLAEHVEQTIADKKKR